MKSPLKAHSGFTIVEMLVAIGLFSIIVTIAVGGFARALRTQRQAQLLLAVNSNVNQALETMAREIRTGVEFSLKPGAYPNYTFMNAKGETVLYLWRKDLGELWRMKQVATPQSSTVFLGGGIIGDNVRVTNAAFDVQGTDKKDGFPPRVTIMLGVVASTTDPGISGSPVRLQTTVSARLMDDDPPTLTVRKDVRNLSTGIATSSDFTMAVVGYKVRPCGKPANYSEEQWHNAVEELKKGICGDFINRTPNKPDVCIFAGSQKGTTMTLAEGEFCVDERQLGNYTKSFDRDCKGQSEALPELGRVAVNEAVTCDVYNTDSKLNP
ncbi:MAG: type II secretion system protein [Candidatus Liptonbacteria bacterium]|nr:type II secretion system protein [Candidatus Liptonbacteria bacterium]